MKRYPMTLEMLLLACQMGCNPLPTDLDGDGHSIEQGDCNDADKDIYEGNRERCDGKDNDCNGVTDGSDAIDRRYWFSTGSGSGSNIAADQPETAPLQCDAPTVYERVAQVEVTQNGMPLESHLLALPCTQEGRAQADEAHVPVCTRVQEALDIAQAKDVIGVGAGVYHEHLTFPATPLSVVSVAGARETTIDGTRGCFPRQDPPLWVETPFGVVPIYLNPDPEDCMAVEEGSVITFNRGQGLSTLLMGFTVQGGSGTPAISGCSRLEATDGGTNGGGICVSDASPLLAHLIVRQNEATRGAGIYAYGSNLLMIDLQITDNTGETVYRQTADGASDEEGMASTHNRATVAADQARQASLNELQNTIAEYLPECMETPVPAEEDTKSSVLSGLSSPPKPPTPPSIPLPPTFPPPFPPPVPQPPPVFNTGSEAATTIGLTTFAMGGGIYLEEGEPVIHRTDILQNQSNLGGGIYALNSSFTLTNALIAGNKALGRGTSSGGILISSFQTLNRHQVSFRNVTVAHNQAARIPGISVQRAALNLTASIVSQNTLFADGNDSDAYGNFAKDLVIGDDSTVTGSYNCFGDTVPGMDEGTNLIGCTPDFYQLLHQHIPGANYRLRVGSPGVDKGSPAPDLEDPDGTRNDMGAYGGRDADVKDLDGDTLPDRWELAHGLSETSDNRHCARIQNGTILDVPCDIDGDGLTDPEEYQLGTEPLKDDSDGDGLTDREEMDPNQDGLPPLPLIDATADENSSSKPELISNPLNWFDPLRLDYIVTVPDDFPSIAVAVQTIPYELTGYSSDSSEAVATIRVRPGEYHEQIRLLGLSIQIEGLSENLRQSDSSDDPANLQTVEVVGVEQFTTIEAYNANLGLRNITLQSSDVSVPVNAGVIMMDASVGTWEDIQISGSARFNGGCVLLDNSNVLLRRATLFECEANTGGGIFAVGSELHVQSSLFGANQARQGAGGAILLMSSHAFVDSEADSVGESSEFVGNATEFGGGGAIRAQGGSSVEAVGTRFSDNLSKDGNGGALNVIGSSSFKLVGGVFSGNRTDHGFGGAAFVAGSTFNVTDSSLEWNHTLWGDGGAIAATKSDVTLQSSTSIANNRAEHGSGGTFALVGGTTRLIDVTIQGSEALEGAGGVLFSTGSSLLICETELSGGTAISGGGVYAQESVATMVNAVFNGNEATDKGWTPVKPAPWASDGGAIYAEHSALKAAGLTITSSNAEGNGGGFALDHSSAAITGITSSQDLVDVCKAKSSSMVSSVAYEGVVKFNQTEGNGGGGSTDCSILGYVNGLIHHNKAAGTGGGLDLNQSLTYVASTTIADNEASLGAGIHHVTQLVPLVIWNSILGFNKTTVPSAGENLLSEFRPNEYYQPLYERLGTHYGTALIGWSTLYSALSVGGGALSTGYPYRCDVTLEDPLFVDHVAYELSESSPADYGSDQMGFYATPEGAIPGDLCISFPW